MLCTTFSVQPLNEYNKQDLCCVTFAPPVLFPFLVALWVPCVSCPTQASLSTAKSRLRSIRFGEDGPLQPAPQDLLVRNPTLDL